MKNAIKVLHFFGRTYSTMRELFSAKKVRDDNTMFPSDDPPPNFPPHPTSTSTTRATFLKYAAERDVALAPPTRARATISRSL